VRLAGVDVSSHNHPIPWSAAADSGVRFVIARATDLAVAGVRGNDHHIRDIMLLAVVTSSSTSSTPCSPTSTDGWATS